MTLNKKAFVAKKRTAVPITIAITIISIFQCFRNENDNKLHTKKYFCLLLQKRCDLFSKEY